MFEGFLSLFHSVTPELQSFVYNTAGFFLNIITPIQVLLHLLVGFGSIFVFQSPVLLPPSLFFMYSWPEVVLDIFVCCHFD